MTRIRGVMHRSSPTGARETILMTLVRSPLFAEMHASDHTEAPTLVEVLAKSCDLPLSGSLFDQRVLYMHVGAQFLYFELI